VPATNVPHAPESFDTSPLEARTTGRPTGIELRVGYSKFTNWILLRGWLNMKPSWVSMRFPYTTLNAPYTPAMDKG